MTRQRGFFHPMNNKVKMCFAEFQPLFLREITKASMKKTFFKKKVGVKHVPGLLAINLPMQGFPHNFLAPCLMLGEEDT